MWSGRSCPLPLTLILMSFLVVLDLDVAVDLVLSWQQLSRSGVIPSVAVLQAGRGISRDPSRSKNQVPEGRQKLLHLMGTKGSIEGAVSKFKGRLRRCIVEAPSAGAASYASCQPTQLGRERS
jgi:hypothetical protein